jgi:RNA polymerase sigma-70 factor (ECF subfamily)
MRAAQAGGREAYVRLLDDISGSFRQFAAGDLRKFGLQTADVEDVLQDVLLTIHLKRHTWQSDLPFLPWLRAIVRHKLIDFVRRHHRRGEVPIGLIAENFLPAHPAPDAPVPIQQVLQHLPARQRQVVESVAIKGATIDETAQELRMTRGAVYVAFHRALAALALKFGRSNG